MKSVGEVMAVGRRFEEALQKALRMVNEGVNGLEPITENLCEEVICTLMLTMSKVFLYQDLTNPTDKRIFAIATALYDTKNYSVKKLAELTQIDPWFLSKMNNIMKMTRKLEAIDCKVLPFFTRTLLPWFLFIFRIFQEK